MYYIIHYLNGVFDVDDGTIELLLGVGTGLANLPHQQSDYLLALRLQAGNELLDVVDALFGLRWKVRLRVAKGCTHRHSGPSTAAVIECTLGGIYGVDRLLLGENRVGTCIIIRFGVLEWNSGFETFRPYRPVNGRLVILKII